MKRILSTLAILLSALVCQTAIAQSQCNPSFTYQANSASYLNYSFTNTTVTNISGPGLLYFMRILNSNNGYLASVNIGATGSTAQYTFPSSGTFKVVLTMVDSTSPTIGCYGADTQTITITSICQNNFDTVNVSCLTATFMPNNATQGSFLWSFGDGTSSTQAQPTHTYATAGTRTVTLTYTYNNCTSVSSHTYNFGSKIYGAIIPTTDSLQTFPGVSYKVWLIQFNANTNMLSAIDSQIITPNGNSGYAQYAFNCVAQGNYLVKAKELSGFQLLNGGYMLPTYHDSSIYWSAAQTIVHTGLNSWANITMKQGALSTGPGFIAGDVTQGANRPAPGAPTAIGDPVKGMNMYLKDASGKVVKYTTTDNNGHYTFNNIPVGTYTVFPDAINFETLPYNNITVTAASPSQSGKDFTQTATQVKPKSGTGINNTKLNIAGVYPNPVTNVINIQWKETPKNTSVQLFNLIGKEVYTAAAAVKNIDISNLSNGIYFLKITTDKGTQTLKVTKH